VIAVKTVTLKEYVDVIAAYDRRLFLECADDDDLRFYRLLVPIG